MSPEEMFWIRDERPRNRTVKAEKRERGLCLVERDSGTVLREVYMTKDQMLALGRDCIRLVKETGGNLSQER